MTKANPIADQDISFFLAAEKGREGCGEETLGEGEFAGDSVVETLGEYAWFPLAGGFTGPYVGVSVGGEETGGDGRVFLGGGVGVAGGEAGGDGVKFAGGEAGDGEVRFAGGEAGGGGVGFAGGETGGGEVVFAGGEAGGGGVVFAGGEIGGGGVVLAGGEAGGVGGLEAASISISTFIPRLQCPVVPQMKYRFPEETRGMVVAPPDDIWIGLLLVQVS